MRVNKTLFKSVFIIQSQAPNRKCRYSVQFTFSKTRRSLLGENNVFCFFWGKIQVVTDFNRAARCEDGLNFMKYLKMRNRDNTLLLQ